MIILKIIANFFRKANKQVLIILATILAIGVSMGIPTLKRYQELKATPRVTDSQISEAKFEEISELAVAQMTYQGITEVRNEWWFDKLDEVSLMKYTATITTSVDLSNVTPIIDEDKHTIIVKIPPASKPEINIKKKSIEWIDVSMNTLEGPKFTKQGLKQAKQECRQDIDETELMKTANQNAQIAIENLYAAFTQGSEDDKYKLNIEVVDAKTK